VPSAVRTRGRRTPPPAPEGHLAGLAAVRTAARAGLWRPLGPTSRATSSASRTSSTCRPAQPPGRAGPRGGAGQFGNGDGHLFGSSSFAWSVVAERWVSFGTAVPFWSSFLVDARHLPHGRHQAGTASSTSTETGTTSDALPQRIRQEPVGQSGHDRESSPTTYPICTPARRRSGPLITKARKAGPHLIVSS
jgi:hypothetical protein